MTPTPIQTLQRTRSAVTAEAAAYGTKGGRCLSGEHPASGLLLSATTQPPRQLRASLSLRALGASTHLL
jgi:hypothetical protein